jgi:histidine triad (HIT) family protein
MKLTISSALFPLRPNLLGHTLIVTRRHYEHAGDCPAGIGASVFAAAQHLDRRYREALGSTGFNLLNASGADAEQSVPHFQFHFFPRRAGDGLSTWPQLPPFDVDLDALQSRLRDPR